MDDWNIGITTSLRGANSDAAIFCGMRLLRHYVPRNDAIGEAE